MCALCKNKTNPPPLPQNKGSNAANLTKTCYINCSLFDVFFLTITHFLFEGCDTLMYDNNCAPCPTNCEDNICHRQHGTCFTCKPGWVGMFCNKSMINEIIQLISHL